MGTSYRRIFASEQQHQRAWSKYRTKRRRKLIRLLVYIGMGLLPPASWSVPSVAHHPGYVGVTAGLGWTLTLGWAIREGLASSASPAGTDDRGGVVSAQATSSRSASRAGRVGRTARLLGTLSLIGALAACGGGDIAAIRTASGTKIVTGGKTQTVTTEFDQRISVTLLAYDPTPDPQDPDSSYHDVAVKVSYKALSSDFDPSVLIQELFVESGDGEKHSITIPGDDVTVSPLLTDETDDDPRSASGWLLFDLQKSSKPVALRFDTEESGHAVVRWLLS